jgi:DNA invertase Pin-like site-specific DNA recombinase
MDKVMLSLATFAAEMERHKARLRTYDTMIRKARARHVTGGKVYGYDTPRFSHKSRRMTAEGNGSTSCGASTRTRRR